MIEPKDLRLGNLVSLLPDRFGLLLQVTAISPRNVALIPADQLEIAQTLDAEQVYGIPITSTLLGHFGFAEVVSPDAIQYELEGFFMQEDEDGFGLSPVPTYWIRVSYVHQLMNLFFALTGEDLVLTAH